MTPEIDRMIQGKTSLYRKAHALEEAAVCLEHEASVLRKQADDLDIQLVTLVKQWWANSMREGEQP